MECDLHVHSNYSFDSLMTPRNIIRTAKLRGLSAISVTDHGTMEVYNNEFSDRKRETILNETGVLVIKGMEIKTNRGDVIGLFLDEEITSVSFDNVIREIRNQNGIIVLPHPFHRTADPRELVEVVDLLEGENGRCTPEQNEKARALSESAKKPILGGSDAHMYWEIGQVRTSFSGRDPELHDASTVKHHLLESERSVVGSPLPYLVTHGVSFASSRVKNIIEGVRE